MAFLAAMNMPGRTQGVKGSNCYTHSGSSLLDLFTQLVRGAYVNETLVKRCLAESVDDTVVLAFQTRDIRGGKGERELFRQLMRIILKARPELSHLITDLLTEGCKRPVADLLKLIPEYGRWDDVWSLVGISPAVDAAIDETVLEQFHLDQESQSPSLLAKWLPREKGEKVGYKPLSRFAEKVGYKPLSSFAQKAGYTITFAEKVGAKPRSFDGAAHFANLLFPLTPVSQRLRVYRKTLSYLNSLINTTEVKMCARNWASIAPGLVPGQLMKRNKYAFLNLKPVILRGRTSRTDVRYPESEDRIICADNFKEHFANGCSVKGGQTTMPNEHVHQILKQPFNTDVDAIIDAQWAEIRAQTLKSGGLGKVVMMCDFSGSMDGVPKEVSLALGVLGSEVAAPAFRDHILTFDSVPVWHSFKGLRTLRDKVESVGDLGQGTSTNLQAACNLVLERLVEHKVPVDEAPTQLIIITDMGFDCAHTSGKWTTHFQSIREAFKAYGYTPPVVVCWNVSAEYADTHALAIEEGVIQLSGWSPSVLKALQTGLEVQTPYSALRALLDSPRYQPVLEALRE